MARQAALAFDRSDHRRLFAADIGAGAATLMDAGVANEPGLLDLAISPARRSRTSGYSSRR
jgi:hypothetical protein